MNIETIEIAGLAGALTALRIPFGKEVRSKIENYYETHLDFTDMDVEKTEDTYEVTMKGLLKFTSNTSIDIENACKACENELRRLKTLLNERGVRANIISVGKSLSRIRKEMEG